MAEQNPQAQGALDAANVAALDKLRAAKKGGGASTAPDLKNPPATAADRPVMTPEDQKRLEDAMATIRELQGKQWSGNELPPAMPEMRQLTKYRLRLRSVTFHTAGSKAHPELRNFMRNTKRYIHPATTVIAPEPLPKPEKGASNMEWAAYHADVQGRKCLAYNFECPDGLDVVEAYSPGEAWEKFRKRFNIVRVTEQTPSITVLGSEEDRRAEEMEERGEVIDWQAQQGQPSVAVA
jgi:hypothetical protein